MILPPALLLGVSLAIPVVDKVPVCEGIAQQGGVSFHDPNIAVEATMGGESSYTELLTCLEMARDVRALHNDQQKQVDTGPIPTAPPGHAQPKP